VHTSTKARLISVVIRIRICDAHRHQNLIFWSLGHCLTSLKISCKSVQTFLRKVVNKKTEQTNNDDYIPSLAEVIIYFHKANHTHMNSLMLCP